MVRDISRRTLEVVISACLAFIAYSGAEAASFNPFSNPSFSIKGTSELALSVAR